MQLPTGHFKDALYFTSRAMSSNVSMNLKKVLGKNTPQTMRTKHTYDVASDAFLSLHVATTKLLFINGKRAKQIYIYIMYAAL